jgi:DNA-binding NarL/FixJ family response regulator
MSYESRAYDEPARDGFGPDPVVVLVVKGTHDVSRLVNLFAHGTIEQIEVGKRINAQVRRDAGGRAALELLAAHGGPDFSPPPRLVEALTERRSMILRRILAGRQHQQISRELGVSKSAVNMDMARARAAAGAASTEQLLAWLVYYGLLTPEVPGGAR